MVKYKTEFDLPYDINYDTKRFWNMFIKNIKLKKIKDSIIAYNAFCRSRKLLFNRLLFKNSKSLVF